MSYVGGKSRTCKEIAMIIKEYVEDKPVKGYYEPFCGGLSVACLMTNYEVNCSDYNEDLIYFWNEVKSGNFNNMPLISKEYFTELKNTNTLSIDKSFAMFWCTYMRFYRGSYMPNKYESKSGTYMRYHSSAYNSIKRKEEHIKLMNFECYDYKSVDEKVKTGGFIVYCDPPYVDTAQPYKVKTFDTEEFWVIMKRWADYGNYVFVSEKSCPIEHILLHSKNLVVSIGSTKKTMADKLFLII